MKQITNILPEEMWMWQKVHYPNKKSSTRSKCLEGDTFLKFLGETEE